MKEDGNRWKSWREIGGKSICQSLSIYAGNDWHGKSGWNYGNIAGTLCFGTRFNKWRLMDRPGPICFFVQHRICPMIHQIDIHSLYIAKQFTAVFIICSGYVRCIRVLDRFLLDLKFMTIAITLLGLHSGCVSKLSQQKTIGFLKNDQFQSLFGVIPHF